MRQVEQGRGPSVPAETAREDVEEGPPEVGQTPVVARRGDCRPAGSSPNRPAGRPGPRARRGRVGGRGPPACGPAKSNPSTPITPQQSPSGSSRQRARSSGPISNRPGNSASIRAIRAPRAAHGSACRAHSSAPPVAGQDRRRRTLKVPLRLPEPVRHPWVERGVEKRSSRSRTARAQSQCRSISRGMGRARRSRQGSADPTVRRRVEREGVEPAADDAPQAGPADDVDGRPVVRPPLPDDRRSTRPGPAASGEPGGASRRDRPGQNPPARAAGDAPQPARSTAPADLSGLPDASRAASSAPSPQPIRTLAPSLPAESGLPSTAPSGRTPVQPDGRLLSRPRRTPRRASEAPRRRSSPRQRRRGRGGRRPPRRSGRRRRRGSRPSAPGACGQRSTSGRTRATAASRFSRDRIGATPARAGSARSTRSSSAKASVERLGAAVERDRDGRERPRRGHGVEPGRVERSPCRAGGVRGRT